LFLQYQIPGPREDFRRRMQLCKSEAAGSAWDLSLKLGHTVFWPAGGMKILRSCATK